MSSERTGAGESAQYHLMKDLTIIQIVHDLGLDREASKHAADFDLKSQSHKSWRALAEELDRLVRYDKRTMTVRQALGETWARLSSPEHKAFMTNPPFDEKRGAIVDDVIAVSIEDYDRGEWIDGEEIAWLVNHPRVGQLLTEERGLSRNAIRPPQRAAAQ
jgi:hypothetical protein